jgi:hypothetical protein
MRQVSSRCPPSAFPEAFHGHPDFLILQMQGLLACGLPLPTLSLLPSLSVSVPTTNLAIVVDLVGQRNDGGVPEPGQPAKRNPKEHCADSGQKNDLRNTQAEQ